MYPLWVPSQVLLPILFVIIIRLFEKNRFPMGEVLFSLVKTALRSYLCFVFDYDMRDSGGLRSITVVPTYLSEILKNLLSFCLRPKAKSKGNRNTLVKFRIAA